MIHPESSTLGVLTPVIVGVSADARPPSASDCACPDGAKMQVSVVDQPRAGNEQVVFAASAPAV